MVTKNKYCNSLVHYSRRETITANIGGVLMGGQNPIRIQSMITTNTMDTKASVNQIIDMVEAGCEYVRITTPSIKDAENLKNIKKELLNKGYSPPLVADVHYTPNAAEIAAKLVEKVRINPGNYGELKKQSLSRKKNQISPIENISKKFIPLINICKEYGTALRIGSNHGSLSKRILNKYGNTPAGMVESALEYIRICSECNFHNVVLSIKASNTAIMIEAYRLLVNKLLEENLPPYPLHLGVTEAGEGEDGRIKSAVGIGTLLEEGLGDTIRVSLTEHPEKEIHAAKTLVNRYKLIDENPNTLPIQHYPIHPFTYNKRSTKTIKNIGSSFPPIVVADLSQIENIDFQTLSSINCQYDINEKSYKTTDFTPDFVYVGNQQINIPLPSTPKVIYDHSLWQQQPQVGYPLLSNEAFLDASPTLHPTLNFIMTNTDSFLSVANKAQKKDNIVIILESRHKHSFKEMRSLFVEMLQQTNPTPIVVSRTYNKNLLENICLDASIDCGGLLIDGLGNGIMLRIKPKPSLEEINIINKTSFNILQATGDRISKTEYISCPSCGRTQFNLEETSKIIRNKTSCLKGLKIAIMGCIVNGTGEMADADYGYVGAGKGKITLYRQKDIVKTGIDEKNALEELINLIKRDGKWVKQKND